MGTCCRAPQQANSLFQAHLAAGAVLLAARTLSLGAGTVGGTFGFGLSHGQPLTAGPHPRPHPPPIPGGGNHIWTGQSSCRVRDSPRELGGHSCVLTML